MAAQPKPVFCPVTYRKPYTDRRTSSENRLGVIFNQVVEPDEPAEYAVGELLAATAGTAAAPGQCTVRRLEPWVSNKRVGASTTLLDNAEWYSDEMVVVTVDPASIAHSVNMWEVKPMRRTDPSARWEIDGEALHIAAQEVAAHEKWVAETADADRE